ncbi:hypothetical protein OG21DRAFT_1504244 [Imleria badia]|nr:hypothetical protein OG21DRAFT_1504244 [Imleria badia]
MALVLPASPMTTSILLRPPSLPSPSSSPSPSPVSTPLPGLQPDLSSSSSSSASGSYLDLHRASSARSNRRIRFALPLPEPNRDLLLDPQVDDPQVETKPATQPPPPNDSHDGFVALSPTISPASTLSSARSTPTIRLSPNTLSKNTRKSTLRLLSFFRRADSSNGSPISQSASLPGSRNHSLSSLTRSSSVPNSPSFHSAELPRISTDHVLSLGRRSLFRTRSGSATNARPPRPSSPPPKLSGSSKFVHRSASTGSSPAKPINGKRDWGEGSSQLLHNTAIAGSGPRKRRASSSALTLGAGGGRHTSSVKMLPNDSPVRPSTAPSSPLAHPKRHVKMLNGRIYGAKRYAAQTLANPFANVREEPEFVEWGYGGMGSVHASAGIANDMWKGLQRSERGGALLAGSSFGSPSASPRPAGAVTAGGGRGSGARATSPIVRRKMSDSVPECGMGNVSAGGGLDEDDGSGMGWVKRRRAEKEAKARLEQESKELERKTQEKRNSGVSMDASMYASTASTATSLTACTSAASTDLTTPTTSPLASRSPSMADLKLASSPPSESCDLRDAPPSTVTGEQSSKSDTAHPAPASKVDREHHVRTAVRLSPTISSASHKHKREPLSPVDTETTSNSSGDDVEEPSRGTDEEVEQDDVGEEHDVQDVRRKTALGAGVEKISRHVDVEAR